MDATWIFEAFKVWRAVREDKDALELCATSMVSYDSKPLRRASVG
jgi:hypothetical protein